MTSIDYTDWVHKGTKVTAKWGVGNGARGEGRVIAYSQAPQVLIKPKHGDPFWWRVDLCSEVEQP